MTLLVSKINDIKVLQVGESKISLENKSEDGSKVGGITEGDVVGRGIIKNIDLGRGKQLYTLRVFTTSKNESDTLFQVLHEERFCTVTDKFKGKLKVYVDSVDITDSDSYVGRTIFEINCTVQDEELAPTVNNAVMLANTAQIMEGELAGMVEGLAVLCEDFSTKIDLLTGNIGFNDSALDLLRSGVMSIVDVKISALNAYASVMSRVNNGSDLITTIKAMATLPSGVVGVLKRVSNEKAVIGNKMINNSVTGRYDDLKDYEKSEVTPIIIPKVGDVDFDEVNLDQLSQFEKKAVTKEILASHIVNKTKVIRDIKSILAGGFNSQQDFEKTINETVKRLEYVGYDINQVAEKVHLIKAYANDQRYREIAEINIDRKKPLIAIVYDLYGSLKNYNSIEAMNGFKDNDWVDGKVKVFL